MVNFKGPILVVKDEKISREFYERILSQKIAFDFGACQSFESGLTLQRLSSMKEIFHISQESIRLKSNACILYFETDEFDQFIEELNKAGVEILHELIEQDWGQYSISLYDPDGHPINVCESMESVFRRFQGQGMTPEEIAERTDHPVDFVKSSL